MIDIDAEFSEWFDGLSDDRLRVIVARMSRLMDNWDEHDEEAQERAFEHVAKRMYVTDLMERAEAQGIVRKDGVRDDGEIHWAMDEVL